LGRTKNISNTAVVSSHSNIGDCVTIWHWTQIREHASVGDRSNLGQHVYIGPGVNIGPGCKIQNGAQIFEPAELEEGVFVGPNVVFTNDLNPRAVTPATMTPKSESDWEKVGVTVKLGASIGAGAICLAPVTIGEWSMVGAGAVVIADVPAYALVVGNPAKQIGWVGRNGHKLVRREGQLLCPVTGELYEESSTGSLLLVGVSM
jgi:UDP-2-acetamido-3-amino-2,3-dideoxy-glucuronate N-acetyltransferase